MPDLRDLLKKIDSRYRLPGCKHLSQTAIPQMYARCGEMDEKQLQSVSYFAITSDLWSSHTSELYLSLTAHFIPADLRWAGHQSITGLRQRKQPFILTVTPMSNLV